jgi:integrase/recombinase XerC
MIFPNEVSTENCLRFAVFIISLKIGEIKVSPTESISSLKFYAEKQIPMSKEEMQNLMIRFLKK